MRVIKSEEDLHLLEKHEVLEEEYLKEVEEYFEQLFQALGRGEAYEEFRLDWPEGFIVILEKGDNLKDLSTVGLNSEDDGILGCMPEYVEEIELENLKLYKISVLMDNECMMTYYIKANVLDPRVENWIFERVEKDYGHDPDEEVPF